MRNKKIFAKRLFAVGLCMLTLAGLSAKHKTGQASAQITPESLPCPTCRFGMVGITRGQTIRLNVVNSADIPPGPCRTSGDDIPPGLCRQRVDLIFLDSLGRTLAHSTETLLAGRAAFLDFDGDMIEHQGNRLELRPLVLVPPPDPDRGNRSFIVASAEVFNSETGRTVFFIPAAGPDPTVNDFSLSASPSSISVTSGAARGIPPSAPRSLPASRKSRQLNQIGMLDKYAGRFDDGELVLPTLAYNS